MPNSVLPPSVVARVNRLALRSLQKLEPTRENLVLAPITTQLALQMTALGARGNTATELAKLLGLKPEQGLLVAQEIRNLAEANRDTTGLRIASGLYIDESLPLVSAYEKALRDGYHANAVRLPFVQDPEAARTQINRDVASHTDQKLDNLLPPGAVHALTRAVLVSAVTLSAPWQAAFDPKETSEGPFQRADNTESNVPFMQRDGEFLLGMLGEDTTVIELPYAGGALAMDIVLPPPRHSSHSVYDPEILGRTLERLSPAHIRLKLPRFTAKLESMSLKSFLISLGASELFSAKADLSGLAGKPHDLWIDDVLHGAFVEVHEKGTEASGASAVTIRTRSAGPRPPPTVAVDRPFLFLIRQVSSGLILFAGRIGAP